MKIIYKKGNLINASEDAIAHGCNIQGVMGSGVAKDIKENFPYAYEMYKLLCDEKEAYLGEIQPILASHRNIFKVVINCFTQEFYGRDNTKYVDYDAIRSCMREINKLIKNIEKKSVAMPKIGAGLGGGDWTIISQIIEEELIDIQPVVYEL